MADTLQELWISYNSIEKMKGIGVLKNLKVGLGQIFSPGIKPGACITYIQNTCISEILTSDKKNDK